MNESNHESKKITWTQILRAVIQAAIAALTALGPTKNRRKNWMVILKGFQHKTVKL